MDHDVLAASEVGGRGRVDTDAITPISGRGYGREGLCPVANASRPVLSRKGDDARYSERLWRSWRGSGIRLAYSMQSFIVRIGHLSDFFNRVKRTMQAWVAMHC
jgi:hypothetical protein